MCSKTLSLSVIDVRALGSQTLSERLEKLSKGSPPNINQHRCKLHLGTDGKINTLQPKTLFYITHTHTK